MQKLNKLTDDMLVDAYANGNDSAFDELLSRHQSRIFTYINNIVRNNDVANDIFQETFVKVICVIRQHRYNANGKFVSWVMRIAHNLVIDYYRQGKSENTVTVDDEERDLLNRRELSELNIEDMMVDSQILEDVRKIYEALPEAQREVVEMRFYRDMSFKEIAEATNVSINTALGRMRYAIMNMRRIAKENHIALWV